MTTKIHLALYLLAMVIVTALTACTKKKYGDGSIKHYEYTYNSDSLLTKEVSTTYIMYYFHTKRGLDSVVTAKDSSRTNYFYNADKKLYKIDHYINSIGVSYHIQMLITDIAPGIAKQVVLSVHNNQADTNSIDIVRKDIADRPVEIDRKLYNEMERKLQSHVNTTYSYDSLDRISESLKKTINYDLQGDTPRPIENIREKTTYERQFIADTLLTSEYINGKLNKVEKQYPLQEDIKVTTSNYLLEQKTDTFVEYKDKILGVEYEKNSNFHIKRNYVLRKDKKPVSVRNIVTYSKYKPL